MRVFLVSLLIFAAGCGSEPPAAIDSGVSSPPDAGAGVGGGDLDSDFAYQTCLSYTKAWVDYAEACGASPTEAVAGARREIVRITYASPTASDCSAVVHVDEDELLNNCLPALESILVDCTGPEDFYARAKGLCDGVEWTLRDPVQPCGYLNRRWAGMNERCGRTVESLIADCDAVCLREDSRERWKACATWMEGAMCVDGVMWDSICTDLFNNGCS